MCHQSLRPAATTAAYFLAGAAGFIVDLWWSGSGITTRMWAEDGEVFLAGAYRMPYLAALSTPYAGYLHVVPRSLAALTTLFPLRDAAWILAASAAAVRSLVALFVFRASSGQLRSTAVRIMLAASVVLLPVGGLEVLDNIANLHWFLTFAAFWAMLWRPASRWDCVLAAAVVIAAADSDPMTFLLLPLVVLRAVTLRSRRDQLITASFVIAGAVQAWVVIHHARPQHESVSTATAAKLFGVRVMIGTFAGYWHTVALWRHWHYAAVALGSLALGALIWPALRDAGPRRRLAICCVAGSALTFIACFAEPAVPPHMRLDAVSSLTRYDVLASLMMLSAVAAGLDSLRRPSDLAVRALVAAVFLAALPVDLLGSSQLWGHLERTAPTWHAAIANARLTCLAEESGQLPTNPGEVGVPILPDGWRVELPCSVLIAQLSPGRTSPHS